MDLNGIVGSVMIFVEQNYQASDIPGLEQDKKN